MVKTLLITFTILYALVLGLLFVYGMNYLYLTWITWRRRKEFIEPPQLLTWPRVTVQLPIYNEMYVAERLIHSAAGLDYPRHLLEIQVLDDSTDETAKIAGDLVACLTNQGFDIVHIHRAVRKGYKAGALAAGLASSNGEFLAIFDADFLPRPDFLKLTLPYFQDRRIGFVQSRWGHINRDYSLLTALQALSLDAHFMVEQFARCQSGFWFNFNGTAGVWRRETMLDVGGWKADTLTEDLDISYRTFLSGWRALFLRGVEVPAELPVSISAYRRQQHRWARGSLECARKYIPQVWKQPIPISQKIEATIHLTGYGVHLLLCALVLLYPVLLGFSSDFKGLLSLFGIAVLFNLTTFSPSLFFLVAQRQLGNRSWKTLPLVILISALYAGMMLNTVRAALHILRGEKGVFERTPKFGIIHKKQAWTDRRYQIHFDAIIFFELVFALVNALTFYLAVRNGSWIIAFYAALFSLGLLYTSGSSIAQALAVLRTKNKGATSDG